MILIARNQLLTLAPRARTEYLDAFSSADDVLPPYDINTTFLRLAHFSASELGGKSPATEVLCYGTAVVVERDTR